MQPALVISPHLDDAVLSAGQLLAGWPDCVVATVCAGTPGPDVAPTTFDANSGFGTPSSAVASRRREDERALASLRARPIHLKFLDEQYRPGVPLLPIDVAGALSATLMACGPAAVFGPLGLVHPDHEAVAAATLLLGALYGTTVWLYEDLPSRVLYPESVQTALERVRSAGWVPTLLFAGTGPRRAKEAAVRRYRSQAWALDRHCLYVPERFWRLKRS